MVRIFLDGVGVRYGRYPVFSPLTHTFSAGESSAVLGANGSGKSTLLRVLAGMRAPSAGAVRWEDGGGKPVQSEAIFRHVAYCAPGMELVEEMTLREAVRFQQGFKPFMRSITGEDVIQRTGLPAAAVDKQLVQYSSGMKQRVKLALAIFSAAPILLLDEPSTNLDDAGVAQYDAWMREAATPDRLIIVASNDPREYAFVQQMVRL